MKSDEDEHQEMRENRAITSSSIFVSKPNIKKNMIGKDSYADKRGFSKLDIHQPKNLYLNDIQDIARY